MIDTKNSHNGNGNYNYKNDHEFKKMIILIIMMIKIKRIKHVSLFAIGRIVARTYLANTS